MRLAKQFRAPARTHDEPETAVPIIDPNKLEKWKRGETERRKLFRVGLGLWHNLLPKLTGWTVSPSRLFFGILRFVCVLGVGLAPVWLKIYENSTQFSWGGAVIYSVLIAVALTYGHFYDKTVSGSKSRSTSRKQREMLILETSGMLKQFGDLIKLKRVELMSRLDSAQSELLKSIRNASRIQLSDFDGTCIEAALFLFSDEACTSIKIDSRTTTSRPTGTVKPCGEVMAYWVAMSKKHRVVHDFMKDSHPFPKEGLSGGKPTYRSILMIPLLDTSDDGSVSCLGVVTIDSTRPFHFWPGNGEDLVLRLRPYCSFLAIFLKLKTPYRLKY